ncbi:uncharacterized protein isoform X3 [Takifugu rubripes]|uniref:uncharacterized protein isoform X3 n=1 Tax=Takifugu rubripes TaxID=31033 RepID=UPI0011455377|nr:uncharacterized protein LOC105418883 isoform X3 [Takifugu rubripes]
MQRGGGAKGRRGGGRKRRWKVKIARHLLRKHADEEDVAAASELPAGSKQRHLLLDHLRCKGNYLHNIEVIRQGTGEIIPWRLPSEDVDARNYLPCPLCLGFFLRADLWKHQVSCRKKTSKLLKISDPLKDAALDSTVKSEDSADDGTSSSTENVPSVDTAPDAMLESGMGDRPRKRFRVQAEASRFLPISSGASESCSEVLHRMNVDDVSHQVKSDWLICKYGNKLMDTQDGNQRRYDYVSQKLRELGRLLLAAKTLNSSVQTLQDLLAPDRLGLTVAAARKASGYRWTCPPLAMKSTLKTVCEIAIDESVQDGDWEAAAKATDFVHQLVKDWDNLGLSNPEPPAVKGVKLKKPLVQPGSEMEREEPGEEHSHPKPQEVLPQSRDEGRIPTVPPESKQPVGPMVPRKVRRRPWTFAEKEAVWRQLGVHVLKQSVPGKEACQRCLDLEPDLKGRHWKDIKNQIHNQIQSQKKQQFHAQVDLEENQRQEVPPIQAKQQQQCLVQMNREKDPDQAKLQHHAPETHQKKKQQFQFQMEPQEQGSVRDHEKQQYHTQMDQLDHLELHKKQLCLPRLDQQDHVQIHKKQLYQMEQQPTLDRESSLLTGALYGPDNPHGVHSQSLLERDPTIDQYPISHRTMGPHIDQLLSRPEWTDESLSQHYSVSRTLLQDGSPIGPPANPHSGHVHF